MSNILTPQSMDVYLTLTLIIVLPLIPAITLFAVLPKDEHASVEGPFQGFKLKLGGAFAAYFVIILFVWASHPIWNPPAQFQVWELDGQVTDDQGNPIEILDDNDIGLDPEPIHREANGGFKLTIATVPTPGGGIGYPRLTIGHKNLRPVTIYLDPKSHTSGGLQLHWDTTNKVVSIGTVALHKLPEYGTAAVVAPIPITNPTAGPNQ